MNPFLDWLQRAPVNDPVDKRNAPAMQVLFLLFGLLLPVVLLAQHLLRGSPLLTHDNALNLGTSVLGLACFVLLRYGYFQLSVKVFLVSVLLMLMVSYAEQGLNAQIRSSNYVAHMFALVLAGLVVGRRALWWAFLVLVACNAVGWLHDVARSASSLAWGMGKVAGVATNFLFVVVLLDRTVAALRESLAMARQRQGELEAINQRLLAEMAERERIQEQLVHAQKMEALGHLASGVAHDFNNILGVIAGYAQWHDRRPHALPQALIGIETTVQRGMEITRKLLGFSRRDAQRNEIFDACQAARALQPMLRQLFRPGIRVELDVPEVPLYVSLDRAQFELVLLNIAGNARDAFVAEGRFRINIRRAEMGLSERVQAMEVMLEDDGPGMSEDIQLRCFEPFFTTKPFGHGTGLGLAMVRNVIDSAGGEIVLQSAAGQGTRIRICLPLAG